MISIFLKCKKQKATIFVFFVSTHVYFLHKRVIYYILYFISKYEILANDFVYLNMCCIMIHSLKKNCHRNPL